MHVCVVRLQGDEKYCHDDVTASQFATNFAKCTIIFLSVILIIYFKTNLKFGDHTSCKRIFQRLSNSTAYSSGTQKVTFINNTQDSQIKLLAWHAMPWYKKASSNEATESQAGSVAAAEPDYRCQLTFTRDNCWRWASASLRTPAIMAWCLRNWMRRRVSSSGWSTGLIRIEKELRDYLQIDAWYCREEKRTGSVKRLTSWKFTSL